MGERKEPQIVDIVDLLTIFSFILGYVCGAVPRSLDVPLERYRGGEDSLATGTGFVLRLLCNAGFLVPLKIRAGGSTCTNSWRSCIQSVETKTTLLFILEVSYM